MQAAAKTPRASDRRRRATLTLTPEPPYDFALSTSFVEGFLPCGSKRELDFAANTPAAGEQRIDQTRLIKAIMLGERTVGFTVRPIGNIERPLLACELYAGDALDTQMRTAARDRIGFYLSVHDDLLPFYARASVDPSMTRLVRTAYGFHQVKFATPFENACHGILAQRTPLRTLKRRKDALVERFGGSIEIDGTALGAFPSATQLSNAREGELSATIGHPVQARRIASCARAFAGVEENWLREGPVEAVERWLRAIDGIGEWTAKFVLIRGLGRMEYHGPVDAPLVATYREVYGRPAASAAEVRRVQDSYESDAGHWAFYLRAVPMLTSGGGMRTIPAVDDEGVAAFTD